MKIPVLFFHLAMLLLPLASWSAQPNIILCMADDQGWGDTAYNGHPLLQTPNLDALAKAGLQFDRFYASSPVCSPTRGSVMTGRHPNRFGCFKWGHSLRPQEITIAERLKDAGYATGHFGKWHLGSVLAGSPVNPGASGFDSWLSAPNFYDNDPILSREGKAVQLHGESSILAADAAIEFMKAQKAAGKSFLAVIWFGSPHSPHLAAAEDKALYPKEKEADWLGEISGLDRAVGKVRAALREMNIADNTLLWYNSDNGGLFTESSGGRGKKGMVYEGGLRVPAVVEWPGHIKPRVTQAVGNTADIYPTILDLLGINATNQPPLDGVSLKAVFDGSDESPHHGMGFWDYKIGGISTPSQQWMEQLLQAQADGKPYHDADRLRLDAGKISKKYAADDFIGHSAWLQWPWKLHRIENTKGKVQWELYNLSADAMETTNQAEAQPERVQAMQRELNTWLHSVVSSLNGEDYK